MLDIVAVLEIADKEGIRYSFDNLSGFPYVPTSDFLITTPNGKMTRSIKKRSGQSTSQGKAGNREEMGLRPNTYHKYADFIEKLIRELNEI